MEAKCNIPKPKVIPIVATSKTYYPHCTVLHRCGDDTGCCLTDASTCVPKKTATVDLYFYVSLLFMFCILFLISLFQCRSEREFLYINNGKLRVVQWTDSVKKFKYLRFRLIFSLKMCMCEIEMENVKSEYILRVASKRMLNKVLMAKFTFIKPNPYSKLI